jgi:uncharacterized protein (TIGR03437 family)
MVNIGSSLLLLALVTNGVAAIAPTNLTLVNYGGHLVANVAPATATGKVTFYDGIAVLGTADLEQGRAAIAAATRASAGHAITAWYEGDENNAASVSRTVTVVPRRHMRPPVSRSERVRPPVAKLQPTSSGLTWTQVNNLPDFYADMAFLLTDGEVLTHDFCSSNWYKLTPDSTGSYINGSWSAAIPMPSNYGPNAFASAVLPDGRVVVTGGEYNKTTTDGYCDLVPDDTNLGAIYDPIANSWQALTAPAGWTNIGDTPSVVLPDGRFLLGNFNDTTMARLDPFTLTWAPLNGLNKADGWYGEEGWTLLPDGTLLTVDTVDDPLTERYTPATDSWAPAGKTLADLAFGTSNAPDALANEMGPAVLRPDGTVFAVGASGHTGIFNTATGKWSAGPDFATTGGVQLAVADGPAALLPSGNVLVGASPFSVDSNGLPLWSTPTLYFEFDGKNLNSVSEPPYSSFYPTFVTSMLTLPTGQVMVTNGSPDVEFHTPPGQPNPAWAPTITSAPSTIVTGQPSGETYILTGTQFNGLSQGSMYGDDEQNATNYPLVRITNTATGIVVYCRTHNHSSMAVATGAITQSTQFDVPNLPLGAGVLEVVVNGIASKTWPVNVIAPAAGPDLFVKMAHTANFVQGQSGATYTITASNVGTASTSGIVTVTGKLPSAFTATAMAGQGWTCVPGTVTCTRSDALAASGSYPAITVTVNVDASSPVIVTNFASVSGGGETNTANDSMTDPTIVDASPLPQTIAFPGFNDIFLGNAPRDIPVTAASSVGLPVSFTAVTSDVCSVVNNSAIQDNSGSTYVLLKILGAGMCSVTAAQPGNAIYAGAAAVTQTLQINQNNQTITFGPLPAAQLGSAPFALAAKASSGLPVSFVSNSTDVCTVNNATVTLVTVGTCSITASQAGNANYAPAAPVTQSFAVSAGVGQTVPVIANVQNAATYQTTLAPNTYAFISGSNLSTTSPGRGWTAADFVSNIDGTLSMPTSLDGTTVTVGGVAAYIEYVSPTQINIVTPPNVVGANVPVLVSYKGQPSAQFNITLLNLAPSFFTWQPATADFGKYLIAQHAADYSNIGKVGLFPGLSANFTTPAKPGETIILYGTGFGPTSPPVAGGIETDKVYALSPTPTATLGGAPATVTFAGLIPPLSQVYQIVVNIPDNAPDGDQALVVTVNGTQSFSGLITVQH